MRFNISWLIKSNFKWLYQIKGKVHWCIIFCSFTMELYLSSKRIFCSIVIFFIFRSFSIQLKQDRWLRKRNHLVQNVFLMCSLYQMFVIICGNLVCTWHIAWLLDTTPGTHRKQEQDVWTKNTTETIVITRDKNTFPSQETSQGHGVQYTDVGCGQIPLFEELVGTLEFVAKRK